MPIFCCYVIALKLNIWLKLKLVWEHLSIFALQSVFGAIRIQLQFLVDFILACLEQLRKSGWWKRLHLIRSNNFLAYFLLNETVVSIIGGTFLLRKFILASRGFFEWPKCEKISSNSYPSENKVSCPPNNFLTEPSLLDFLVNFVLISSINPDFEGSSQHFRTVCRPFAAKQTSHLHHCTSAWLPDCRGWCWQISILRWWKIWTFLILQKLDWRKYFKILLSLFHVKVDKLCHFLFGSRLQILIDNAGGERGTLHKNIKIEFCRDIGNIKCFQSLWISPNFKFQEWKRIPNFKCIIAVMHPAMPTFLFQNT